jgi:acyl carrier protein
MDLNLFVKDFGELFVETEAQFFKSSTEFRNIEEWSSFGALLIIGMVHEKYNIRLTGDDIRMSVTIEDIYNIVKSRK